MIILIKLLICMVLTLGLIMMEIEHSYVQNQSLNGGSNSDIDDDVIDCELIDLYCEHNYLYDKSHPGFKDLGLKENAWIKISNKMMAFGKNL